MAFLYQTRPFSEESKRETVIALREAARPDRDFYLLVIGATLFALFGIVLDSIPVLIGSMIVAPLAAPILTLGLGCAMTDRHLILRSLTTLIIASIGASVIAGTVAYFLPAFSINGTFISFVAHPFYDITIAFIAGVIAAYGYVHTKVGGALTGIGIAVSLMPPLVASSLAMSSLDMPLLRESSIIFVLNVVGILIGSFLIFKIFGINKSYRDIRN